MSFLRKYSMAIVVVVIVIATIGYSMGKKYAYADNAKESSKQLPVDSK